MSGHIPLWTRIFLAKGNTNSLGLNFHLPVIRREPLASDQDYSSTDDAGLLQPHLAFQYVLHKVSVLHPIYSGRLHSWFDNRGITTLESTFMDVGIPLQEAGGAFL